MIVFIPLLSARKAFLIKMKFRIQIALFRFGIHPIFEIVRVAANLLDIVSYNSFQIVWQFTPQNQANTPMDVSVMPSPVVFLGVIQWAHISR